MIYDHIAQVFHPKRISELRENAPRDVRSREDLAKILGVTMKTIEQMESGQYEPSLHMSFKLSAALGVPLEHLLSDDPQSTITRDLGSGKNVSGRRPVKS